MADIYSLLTSTKRKRGKGRLAKSTLAGRRHAQVMKRSKPGTGARFKSLVKQLKAKGGVKNPAAVAAAIGRRKYGKARFQAMAAKGRKRS